MSQESTAARSRALVTLDREGGVVSPIRRYAGKAAAYSALGLLSTIGAFSLFSGDPLVVALSLVGTAAWGHGILVTRWLEQASVLMLRDELDQAERLLQRCLRPPWGSEGVRAHAHLRLAGVAARRGAHALAHQHARTASALFLAEYPSQPQFVRLSRCHEIRALVNTGQLAEARCQLEELGPAPGGDYLRVQHYLTELYVALAGGHVPFLDAALWERAELAWRMPSSGPLLLLLAWAFAQLGDHTTARQLLAGGHNVLDEPLVKTLPLLAEWLGRCEPLALERVAQTTTG